MENERRNDRYMSEEEEEGREEGGLVLNEDDAEMILEAQYNHNLSSDDGEVTFPAVQCLYKIATGGTWLP
jgi:hypothetical protein